MTAIGCPFLHHLKKDDRDSLEILDFYIRDCLWKLIESEGNLSPESIVRLSNCRGELVRELKRLQWELDGYFEHLLLLSKYVLRRFKIKDARLIAKREAELVMEEFFSPSDVSL